MCFIWVRIEGSVYTVFCIFVLLYSRFLAYLETTCISRYTLSETMDIIVFKIEKIACKNSNEEEHG